MNTQDIAAERTRCGPGLGYTTFALAMVTVRLSGNRLLTRYRPDRLLPALAAVATLGFSTTLLIAQPPAALLGFGCLGIGLATVIPAVFSAAGRIPGLAPGTAAATASACGWAGFVCGPPVISRLSAWASLPVALSLLPLLTAFAVDVVPARQVAPVKLRLQRVLELQSPAGNPRRLKLLAALAPPRHAGNRPARSPTPGPRRLPG